MLRGMVFLDHMNFDIAIREYYRKILSAPAPKLDYNLLFKQITEQRDGINFTKAYIFAPQPDEFLMKDPNLSGYYKWVTGMRSSKYIDVVEGRYIARPTDTPEKMIITDRQTFYKVEKGTDLNLAIHALTKAFYNSYDVAFIMSADTDYISLYKQLKTIGKIVVVVAVKGQSIPKVIPEVDDYIFLDENFFKHCLRTQKNPT
ncbi:NYN domain-containing protein [Ruminococcus champanellensis]